MYCQRCRKPLRSLQAQKQHIIDSPQHNVCVRCPQQPDFHSEVELNEHLESKHYLCVPCDRQFGGADQLDQHDVAVHNKCKECPRYLKSASDLKNVRTLTSLLEMPTDFLSTPKPTLERTSGVRDAPKHSSPTRRWYCISRLASVLPG